MLMLRPQRGQAECRQDAEKNKNRQHITNAAIESRRGAAKHDHRECGKRRGNLPSFTIWRVALQGDNRSDKPQQQNGDWRLQRKRYKEEIPPPANSDLSEEIAARTGVVLIAQIANTVEKLRHRYRHM